MKRLTTEKPAPPKEEVPEVYKEKEKEVSFEETEPVSELPKSKLYKRLKKLSSFKQIKKDFKLRSQKDVFVGDIKALLSHLKLSEHEFDTELLVEVMNACEEFFIYGSKEEREASKYEAVLDVMMPFFKDEKILSEFMKTVDNKVKKSSVLRRLFQRLVNFFL